MSIQKLVKVGTLSGDTKGGGSPFESVGHPGP